MVTNEQIIRCVLLVFRGVWKYMYGGVSSRRNVIDVQIYYEVTIYATVDVKKGQVVVITFPVVT